MRKPCDIVAPACHVRVLQVLVYSSHMSRAPYGYLSTRLLVLINKSRTRNGPGPSPFFGGGGLGCHLPQGLLAPIAARPGPGPGARGPVTVTRVITREYGLLTPGSYRGVGEGASRTTGAGLVSCSSQSPSPARRARRATRTRSRGKLELTARRLQIKLPRRYHQTVRQTSGRPHSWQMVECSRLP